MNDQEKCTEFVKEAAATFVEFNKMQEEYHDLIRLVHLHAGLSDDEIDNCQDLIFMVESSSLINKLIRDMKELVKQKENGWEKLRKKDKHYQLLVQHAKKLMETL